MQFVRPDPLAQGAEVFVFAASSPFDRTRYDRGRALVSQRYRVREAANLFASSGFLAGDDDARADALITALGERDVRALIAARGGYGATRLLERVPLASIRAARRWLVGFSDVTALHAQWARAGVCSIHGPMVCSLADASAPLRDEWFRLLEGHAPSPLEGLTCLRPGSARGFLFAANLTVLGALVGTPFFPPLDGAVLALEDVGERPYRLDRTLTQLLTAGALDGVRAIVLGQFTESAAGVDGTSAESVLEERLGTLGVPLLSGAPFGHIAENRPLLNGSMVEVDGQHGVVSFAAPA